MSGSLVERTEYERNGIPPILTTKQAKKAAEKNLAVVKYDPMGILPESPRREPRGDPSEEPLWEPSTAGAPPRKGLPAVRARECYRAHRPRHVVIIFTGR